MEIWLCFFFLFFLLYSSFVAIHTESSVRVYFILKPIIVIKFIVMKTPLFLLRIGRIAMPHKDHEHRREIEVDAIHSMQCNVTQRISVGSLVFISIFFSLFLLLKCYCIGSVRFIFVGYCWFFVSILFWLLFVTWSTVVGLWSRSFAIAFIPLLQFEMNLFIAIVVTVIGKGYLFIALNMLWKWQSFIFKAQIIFIVFFLLNVISFSCMLCYALCVLRLLFFSFNFTFKT